MKLFGQANLQFGLAGSYVATGLHPAKRSGAGDPGV